MNIIIANSNFEILLSLYKIFRFGKYKKGIEIMTLAASE